MLVLDATTDNLQVVLGGSVTTDQMRCYASWRDITTTTYTPGKTVVNTNNTTDVNLVPAPAASTQRVCEYFKIYNADTVAQTLTVKFDANGTEYTLWSDSLAAGESLEYTPGQGFRVFDLNGIPKTVLIPGGSSATANTLNGVVLASDVTNNNAIANTIADVTGLSFSVTAGGTYWFRFVIAYTAAATTTGSRWSVNGPGSPTALRYTSTYSLTATTQTTNHGLSAYDTPATSNATSAATGSNIAVVEGFITPSASGTVIARFASEVSSSAIVAKAGSYLQWVRTL